MHMLCFHAFHLSLLCSAILAILQSPTSKRLHSSRVRRRERSQADAPLISTSKRRHSSRARQRERSSQHLPLPVGLPLPPFPVPFLSIFGIFFCLSDVSALATLFFCFKATSSSPASTAIVFVMMGMSTSCDFLPAVILTDVFVIEQLDSSGLLLCAHPVFCGVVYWNTSWGFW